MRARVVRARILPVSLALGMFTGHVRAQAAVNEFASEVAFNRVTEATPLINGIELHNGSMAMRITALRDDVIRIRASRTEVLPEDASWAVLPEARAASVVVSQDRSSDAVGFHTSSLRILVGRSTGLLTLLDLAGNVLQQDALPLRFEKADFKIAKTMPADEHYFGLGDKTGNFDRRDQAFRLWNTDSYGWQESTDPIYKSIPFYLSYRAGTSLGVLIDNTWPNSFDFGKTLQNVFRYRSEGGPADIYILYGPSAKHVLQSYAWLTGPTPLPPLWVLGFQQSRYSYMSQERA